MQDSELPTVEDESNAEQGPLSGSQERSPSESTVDPDEAAAEKTKENEQESLRAEDRSSRMNAAKAFYRAMYAGEDVVPDDFGMSSGREARVEGSRTCGNCESMQQQMSSAEAKASEVDNLYKRMAADFDNYRKRTDREKEELLGLGMQRAVEALLPAVDDLDRAQGSFNADSEAKAILESLKLIYTRFTKCLEQMGVKPMEVVGQPFDPKFHEPVQQVETNDVPEGAIVHDLRRGYLMKDKVIRPSLVNVAVSAGPEEVTAPAAEESAERATASAPEVTVEPEIVEAQAEVVEEEKPAAAEKETTDEKAVVAPAAEAKPASEGTKAPPPRVQDIASATGELPSLDALAAVSEVKVRSATHSPNAELTTSASRAKKDAAHQDGHKRARTAEKAEAVSDDKKASDKDKE